MKKNIILAFFIIICYFLLTIFLDVRKSYIDSLAKLLEQQERIEYYEEIINLQAVNLNFIIPKKEEEIKTIDYVQPNNSKRSPKY